jgi:hypothetical protein
MEVRCEAEGPYDLRSGVGAFPAVSERESFPMGMVCDTDYAAVHWGLRFADAIVI